jgi:hypothetical protein
MAAIIYLDDAKAELNISAANHTWDAELQLYVDAVTDLIEGYTGPWVNRTVSETVRGGAMIVLSEIPVVSVTTITDPRGILTHNVADTILNARAGSIRPKFAVPFADPVDVVYVAGRNVTPDSIPSSVALAARIAVANLWETQRGNAGAGASDTYADERQRTPGYGFALPNRALALLKRYRKPTGIG